MVGLQDYQTELTTSLSDAWLAAKVHIVCAQDKQLKAAVRQAC